MNTVLVTGATDGIGKATAAALAKMGCQVLVHGRKFDRATAITNELISHSGNNKIIPVSANLASMNEIFAMAQQIRNSFESLDVLINNAGVYMKTRELTEDGLEMTFGVNHISHFLLTNLLLPLIRKSPEGRIVTVSSVAHQRGVLDFTDLQFERGYNGYSAYSLSKLCNILFANKLARLLENDGITSNSLHPGVVTTKLLRAGFSMEGISTSEGAETSVYVATSTQARNVTGKYFSDSRETACSHIASDELKADKLWEISRRFTEKFLTEII
ncbi:MAG: SDR family oxidoreductase [Ignavibacteria bacterium]|nr:SDR family oxidoreductase [Ignavibacteria bacterium]